MEDLTCNRPYCNCVNVERNFRAWYHEQEKKIEALDLEFIKERLYRIEVHARSEMQSYEFIEERRKLKCKSSYDKELILKYDRLKDVLYCIDELRDALGI